MISPRLIFSILYGSGVVGLLTCWLTKENQLKTPNINNTEDKLVEKAIETCGTNNTWIEIDDDGKVTSVTYQARNPSGEEITQDQYWTCKTNLEKSSSLI